MSIMNEENNMILINEELNGTTYETEKIKNLIYTIRGKQVMLDSDVAMLYQYETKKINQTVKRNIKRFPENFCFQLTENELECLRSQFVTLKVDIKQEDLKSQIVTSSLEVKDKYLELQNKNLNRNQRGQHRKYLPYVFTEQGIAMLSGLLRNEIAIQVSINIMNAFVEMRKFISNNGQLFERLTKIEYELLEHNKKFDIIFNELQKDRETEFKQKIFYKGQIYDAYSLVIDLIKKAKTKLVIIDNYIDSTVLNMLTKKNKDVEVHLLTSQNCNLMKLDIQKFNLQYPTLKISHTNQFHDRFLIMDDKEIYHLRSFLKRPRKEMLCYIENGRYGISGKNKSIKTNV